MGGEGVARKRRGSVEIPQPHPGRKVPPRRANYSLADFEKFCSELRTEDGEPLVLEPHERRVLRDHFRGAIEEVVLISKKNGKTTIFAALGLYHLENWPEPEVNLGASSRDQATILFNQAAAMVERSGLEDRFDVKGGYRHIRLRSNPKARMRVLAADAKTADGIGGTLNMIDELHRHPNGDLYGVFRDGIEARNGRMVTMSTAGATLESPLGHLRAKAQKLANYKRRGTYCHASSPDGSFVFHEWSLKDDDDPEDLKLVKKANPASWHTIAKLARRKESPSMTTGRWLRYACGIWTAGEEPWLQPIEWDRLKVDIGGLEDGEVVWASVNVGINPAIVFAANREDGGAAVKAIVYEGEEPLATLEDEILSLQETYQLEEVTYDRGFQRSAELLEEQGVPMLELPHSTERMTNITATLERLIQGQLLRHDGNERLRSHVLAGTIKDSERGKRLVNGQRTRALIAMAIAVHQATKVPNDTEPMVLWS